MLGMQTGQVSVGTAATLVCTVGAVPELMECSLMAAQPLSWCLRARRRVRAPLWPRIPSPVSGNGRGADEPARHSHVGDGNRQFCVPRLIHRPLGSVDSASYLHCH